MQLLIFALAVVVPLVHCYAANKPYPSIGVCDKDVESKIKSHWENKGKPEKFLQRFQASGLFTVTQTSYDHHNSENNCIYMKYANGVMNITFVRKNGNPANIIYNLEERDDGTIKARLAHDDAPEYGWNLYPIYFDQGVVVGYFCGDVEGSKQSPVTTIMVAENDKDSLSKPEIKDIRALIKGWGLKFKYDYTPECDLKDKS